MASRGTEFLPKAIGEKNGGLGVGGRPSTQSNMNDRGIPRETPKCTAGYHAPIIYLIDGMSQVQYLKANIAGSKRLSFVFEKV